MTCCATNQKLLSIRTIAVRWEKTPNNARTLLETAGLPVYVLGPQGHRWDIADIEALEASWRIGSTRSVSDDRLQDRPSRARGPRRNLRGVAA